MRLFTSPMLSLLGFVRGESSLNAFSEIVICTHRGMRIEFLPPYSPDYNPIEEMFSAMKAWIRRNYDYVRSELTGDMSCNPFCVLWDAVFDVGTSENAEGWYRHSGYLTSLN